MYLLSLKSDLPQFDFSFHINNLEFGAVILFDIKVIAHTIKVFGPVFC